MLKNGAELYRMASPEISPENVYRAKNVYNSLIISMNHALICLCIHFFGLSMTNYGKYIFGLFLVDNNK